MTGWWWAGHHHTPKPSDDWGRGAEYLVVVSSSQTAVQTGERPFAPKNNGPDSTKARAAATPVQGPKMAQDNKPQNLQDTFLNHVRKHKVALTVFLVNGVKLQGVITWFDNFCVLLRRDGLSQLVYKHAISTIMPGQPISLFEDDGTQDS
jgi:host factor-I protein